MTFTLSFFFSFFPKKRGKTMNSKWARRLIFNHRHRAASSSTSTPPVQPETPGMEGGMDRNEEPQLLARSLARCSSCVGAGSLSLFFFSLFFSLFLTAAASCVCAASRATRAAKSSARQLGLQNFNQVLAGEQLPGVTSQPAPPNPPPPHSPPSNAFPC